jgi:hypothetical protein
MLVLLQHIMLIHRSGLIIPDSENMEILEECLVFTWLLNVKGQYKMVYTAFESDSRAELCIEDLTNNERTRSVDLTKEEDPLPFIWQLIKELGLHLKTDK